MNNQTEYEILIGAKILSSLKAKQLNHLLVASLFDIESKEKISDGDNNTFEVLEYNFTKVTNISKNRKKYC
jgi:hypothetical protein